MGEFTMKPHTPGCVTRVSYDTLNAKKNVEKKKRVKKERKEIKRENPGKTKRGLFKVVARIYLLVLQSGISASSQ